MLPENKIAGLYLAEFTYLFNIDTMFLFNVIIDFFSIKTDKLISTSQDDKNDDHVSQVTLQFWDKKEL